MSSDIESLLQSNPTEIEALGLEETEDHDVLKPTTKIAPHKLPTWQTHWVKSVNDAIPSPSKALHLLRPSTATEFSWKWSGLQGPVNGYTQSTVRQNSALNAATSTSLSRDPADHLSFVRGSSSHVPFAPGGLEADVVQDVVESLEKDSHVFRTIPPGFERGLDFGALDEALLQPPPSSSVVPVYRPVDLSKEKEQPSSVITSSAPALDSDVSELLPDNRLRSTGMHPGSQAVRHKPTVSKRDWAHVVDVNRELSNFRELVPDMAREYPFELDTFQKEAVYRLENGQSVFVAAHTSAGKTVVAEYAIALASQHMTRAIYTSPIKALSNQKFRDFKINFGHENVGILTGDVQINPDAGCLVMTTEILRSMLYKGADLIRDVEWVIFDEVHYVNDAERGVVWEEVIILLPEHVNIILLSATVPNAREFADWVGRTKKKDIYVISTPKRPVPLEHYLYAGRDIFKIVDETGQFLGSGYKDAQDNLRRRQDKEREAAGLAPLVPRGAAASANRGGRGGPNTQRGGNRGGGGSGNRGGGSGGNERGGRGGRNFQGNDRGGGRGGRGGANVPAKGGQVFSPMRGRQNIVQNDKSFWINLVGMLQKKQLLPVVIFTFSKRRCEENAASMPNTDLNTSSEKSEVHIVIKKSLTRLKPEDKRLPQILNISDLLSRGIGVHHGGLLPIVKEMVELLFARGLVKVLFATETFAMGVNMPARTVVFSHTRKHDGNGFRDLLPGEYTQMSGRAGRRGLDATGIVIVVCTENEPPETSKLQQMILGTPGKLQSQFRLTYSMILNLLRVEALKVEEMIKRSFSENTSQRLLPEQQKQVALKERELQQLPAVDETSENWRRAKEYYNLVSQMNRLNTDLIRMIAKASRQSKSLSGGRIVILNDGHFRNLPAVILKGPYSLQGTTDEYGFVVLAFGPSDELDDEQDIPEENILPFWPPSIRPADKNTWGYELAEIADTSITMVTKYTIKVNTVQILDLDRKLHKKEALKSAMSKVSEMVKEQEKGNSIEAKESDWGKQKHYEMYDILRERKGLASKLEITGEHVKSDQELYRMVHTREYLTRNIEELRQTLSDLNLELLPDYEQRINVLQQLDYIDQKSTVLLKGRVACEFNTASELILTELILENTLSMYEPEEVVSLLSCLIFQEKTESEPILTPSLAKGKEIVQEIADRVEKVQAACRANFKEDDYGNQLNFGLMEVVYEWARGMPFEKVAELTDVQEGTIVRTITRLDECCREVRDAARVIGDASLYQKMETCQLAIRRDVVFCASLYI